MPGVCRFVFRRGSQDDRFRGSYRNSRARAGRCEPSTLAVRSQPECKERSATRSPSGRCDPGARRRRAGHGYGVPNCACMARRHGTALSQLATDQRRPDDDRCGSDQRTARDRGLREPHRAQPFRCGRGRSRGDRSCGFAAGIYRRDRRRISSAARFVSPVRRRDLAGGPTGLFRDAGRLPFVSTAVGHSRRRRARTDRRRHRADNHANAVQRLVFYGMLLLVGLVVKNGIYCSTPPIGAEAEGTDVTEALVLARARTATADLDDDVCRDRRIAAAGIRHRRGRGDGTAVGDRGRRRLLDGDVLHAGTDPGAVCGVYRQEVPA